MLVSGWEKPDSDSIARTVPTPLVVDGERDGDAPMIYMCGVVCEWLGIKLGWN